MANQGDLLRRVCARLLALKQNLPEGIVEEGYVRQFHEALDTLQDVHFDTAPFRVPAEQIERPEGWRAAVVEREFLLMKIDEVLAYFEIPVDRIGFTGPRQQ